MKIIEEEPWWVFTCEACGTKCEAEPGDTTFRRNIDREGDTVGYICVVECGKCGKEHAVPGKLITEKIKNIAISNRLSKR
ncbi:MAG: hypothetical protein WCT16_03230 [Candidatus Buchananbacteria bacterium]